MAQIDRRTFVAAGLSASVGRCVRVAASTAADVKLTAFRDWIAASSEARAAGVTACVDRIRAMDPSIHAWVQVAPQPATGSGPLAGIPFGAKDIIETKGLSTEYGSPIYKGRIGEA